MRTFRLFSLTTVVLVCGLVVAGVHAQAQGTGAAQQPPAGGRQGGGAPPTNLKVLPKDIARPALTATMRGYMSAIGAQNCNYCHTDDMSQRASDANPKKDIARKMIQMTMDLNKQLDAIGTPAAADAPKITCFTCHRGAAKPATAAGGL